MRQLGTDSSASRMPLRGNEFGSSVQDEAPFFESLALLDDWVNKKEHSKLDGVLSYHPRKAVDGIITENKGKLLVGSRISYSPLWL